MSDTTIEISRGRRFFRTWSADPDRPDKALAGASIRMMVRKLPTDPSPIISKAVGSGITIVSDVVNNRAFQVVIESADTSGFADIESKFVWDLALTYSDGDGPYRVAGGPLLITPAVTYP